MQETSVNYAFYRFDLSLLEEDRDMSHFMGVGIFWIGLNLTDIGCLAIDLNVRLSSIQLLFIAALELVTRRS